MLIDRQTDVQTDRLH